MNEMMTMQSRLEIARKGGLVYVEGDEPGYTRQRCGKGFTYRDERGMRVADKALRARFAALGIPPCWSEVWIAPQERAHIQVTGRDDAGRKQYIYHGDWAQLRSLQKFDRLTAFAQALPELRERCDRDMRQRRMSRTRALALAAALLDRAYLRVGNEQYAQENDTRGLTTLGMQDVSVHTSHVIFDFQGKSAQHRHVRVDGRRFARQLGALIKLPGERLFCFEQGDEIKTISADDVNIHLAQAMGEGFTAKDFRTWGGTHVALNYLLDHPPTPEHSAQARLIQALDATSERLGNTRAVCRAHYVDPRLLEAVQDESLWASAPEVVIEREDLLGEQEQRTRSWLKHLHSS